MFRRFTRKKERSFGDPMARLPPDPGGQKTLKALYFRLLVLMQAIAGKSVPWPTTPDRAQGGVHRDGPVGR
jgi:hypothetical protein